MRLRICSAVLLAVFADQTARAETDWVQLTTNMIWCYQNPDHPVEKIANGWSTYVVLSVDKNGVRTWREERLSTRLSRSREEYVRDIQIAAVKRDPDMARDIYLMCQRHNENAEAYADTATKEQWVTSVAHAAACYDPNSGVNSPRTRQSGEVFRSEFGDIECK